MHFYIKRKKNTFWLSYHSAEVRIPSADSKHQRQRSQSINESKKKKKKAPPTKSKETKNTR